MVKCQAKTIVKGRLVTCESAEDHLYMHRRGAVHWWDDHEDSTFEPHEEYPRNDDQLSLDSIKGP